MIADGLFILGHAALWFQITTNSKAGRAAGKAGVEGMARTAQPPFSFRSLINKE